MGLLGADGAAQGAEGQGGCAWVVADWKSVGGCADREHSVSCKSILCNGLQAFYRADGEAERRKKAVFIASARGRVTPDARAPARQVCQAAVAHPSVTPPGLGPTPRFLARRLGYCRGCSGKVVRKFG